MLRRFSFAACLVALACGVSCAVEAESNEIAVATVTRCTEARAAEALPEITVEGRHQPFFAKHPLAPLVHRGGATIPSPRIIGIFLGDDRLQHATEALLQSFGCTRYWREAVGEYGIGDALYARTVAIKELPAAVVNHDYGAFVEWIRVGAAAKLFGEMTPADVLLFFLPPNASVLPDDCTGRLGGHSSLLTADNTPLRYAYFTTCLPTANVVELLSRSHAVTHELMEMATDPDPDLNPGWRGLGPGLGAPSIRPSAGALDDEGADCCNNTLPEAPDYPFASQTPEARRSISRAEAPVSFSMSSRTTRRWSSRCARASRSRRTPARSG